MSATTMLNLFNLPGLSWVSGGNGGEKVWLKS